MSISDSTCHPEFGLSIENKRLVIEVESGKSNIRFYWKIDKCTFFF